MEKSTAPRARFIAAILLFAAVVIGDLILSRGYLAQGPATWPVFLLLELVMLALLVGTGIYLSIAAGHRRHSVLQPPGAGYQQKAHPGVRVFPGVVRPYRHFLCRL